MLQNMCDSLPVNRNSLPLALPQSQELQPESEDDNFPMFPALITLFCAYLTRSSIHFSDNNPHGGNRPPPFAALFVLPALGICLQRACINTSYCLRLSRLIDSFNTSVIIIQQSWFSANSSTELAIQLPVYYFKMSGERSGDSHMPIWLWAACEVPRGIWRVKPGVWTVLSGWWLTTSNIGLNNSPQKRKHVCLQINF